MIVVREFYANAHKVQGSRAMVWGMTINYGALAINQLLRIQNPSPTIDQVITYMQNMDLGEVAQAIYDHEVEWTVIRGERTTFPIKELTMPMKVWHHFIFSQASPHNPSF